MIVGVDLVTVFVLKRMSFVPADGAMVIDVRSPEEFRSGHLAGR